MINYRKWAKTGKAQAPCKTKSQTKCVARPLQPLCTWKTHNNSMAPRVSQRTTTNTIFPVN